MINKVSTSSGKAIGGSATGNSTGNSTGSSNGRVAFSQNPLPILLIVAAVAALATVAVCAFVLRDRVQPAMLAAGGLLSALGLLALLGWLGGLFSFAGATSERPFFDALTDALGDAAVVTDAKGRAIYSNGGYLKLASKAGASRLVGFDMLFAGYPDFAEPIFQLGQASHGGKEMKRDTRVAAGSSAPGASDTEARWLRLSVSPLAGASQKGQTLWRLTDITNDRHHQESAFARLQFIITYLDHAPAGFFSTLPDNKVDYINATLAGWLGVDLLDVQGGALSLAELVGEETAAQLTSMAAIPGGSRTENFSANLSVKSGQPIRVDIVHRQDFDREGKGLPSRSMVLKKDSLVAASLNSNAQDILQQWSAAAPLGIAQLNDAGEVVAANAIFLGFSPQIKRHGLLAPALNKPATGTAAELLASHIAAAALTPGKRIDADVLLGATEPRNVQLGFVRLDAASNEGATTLVFAEDKTERKTLEVQLAQSQKMQAVGQLASGIAHDFNNVLTPIIGFADLLLAKMRPQDSAFTDVMNIKQNANRAANLVRQLLAFSRKQTMQPKLHALTDAMSDLGNLLGRVLGEKTELEIIHGRDLGFVKVDLHQFEQVIINLAVNARDAMPTGGKLLVKTYNLLSSQPRPANHPLPDGEFVVCEVADTGSGIPKAIVEKIWEPFFSTKEVGKGTGLGLSMVYGIIKQSGGYIYCDSEIGKGTTFSIYLPRHYPEATPINSAPMVKVEATREDFTGRGRILVVEDEDSVRAFALRALQSRGYTVVEADSGEAGLAAILEDKDGFELILSDVVMPEMDGPTMLSEIRKRGIKTKFIFMSGYAEDAFERNLENPDDFAFLQKPFALKQLLEKVKEVMG